MNNKIIKIKNTFVNLSLVSKYVIEEEGEDTFVFKYYLNGMSEPFVEELPRELLQKLKNFLFLSFDISELN